MNAPVALVPWEGAPRPPRKWQAEALPIIIEAMKRKVPGVVAACPRSGKSILMAEVARMATARLGDRVIVVTTPRKKLVRQLAKTFTKRLGKRMVGAYYSSQKQAKKQIIICCNLSLPGLRLELAALGRRVVMIMADECHSTEGETLKETITAMSPPLLLGFTGTPQRSKESERLTLFTERLYRYTIDDAVADRVLVPLRFVGVEGRKVDTLDLDEACLALMLEHGNGPGIVSASDIDDAEAYAAWLTERGFPAHAIHSKQPEASYEVLLEHLRTGVYRCLVHVSLLAEGVDIPWLRWICLRRNVGARVRFLQEGLRVAGVDEHTPDKTEGIILDPHMLYGRFGIHTIEALGKVLEEVAEVEAREPVAKMAGREVKESEAVALDLLLSYLEAARASLLNFGIVRERSIASGPWELADISEKLVEAIKKARGMTRHIPTEHRDAIKALARVPWALNRGQACDLLDVLYGGARWCREEAERKEVQSYRVQLPRSVFAVKPPDAGAAKLIQHLGDRKAPKEAEDGT